MGAERNVPAVERLLTKAIRAENGCLIWTGLLDESGYGRIGYQGKTSVGVHRVAYLEWVGLIPDEMQIDHVCHTRDTDCPGGTSCPHRACIEPTHAADVTAEPAATAVHANPKPGNEFQHDH